MAHVEVAVPLPHAQGDQVARVQLPGGLHVEGHDVVDLEGLRAPASRAGGVQSEVRVSDLVPEVRPPGLVALSEAGVGFVDMRDDLLEHGGPPCGRLESRATE